MSKIWKQVIAAVVGASVASIGVWVIVNWMPNTLSLVMAVVGGYVGFKLIK